MERERRDDISVRIAREVYVRAKKIASHRDVPISDYLSQALSAVTQADYEKMLDDLLSEREQQQQPGERKKKS